MIELASLSSLPLAATIASSGAVTIPAAVPSPEFAWAGLILVLPALSAVLCGLCAAMGVRNKLPGLKPLARPSGPKVTSCTTPPWGNMVMTMSLRAATSRGVAHA